MPILKTNFTPTLPFRNAHFNTMYRPLFMKESNNYNRKRITTWDNDFLDLDFSFTNSESIVLLIHGLEGSSESHYMVSTANLLNNNGFDTVCLNLRGCSGEDNLLLQTYHSGKTDDVKFTVDYLVENYNYKQIVVVGFSLGGNMTLKYLGEFAKTLPKEIKGGVAVSVPIDITTSQVEMNKLKNKLYMQEFMRTMKIKLLEKAEKFPDYTLDKKLLYKATKFRHIEKQFTVPVFGFKNSEDYWEKASCKPYIPKINVPSLLINAKDDSFLSKECYPFEEAENSTLFHFMQPKYGGHVGFINSFKAQENYWLENKIVSFVKDKLTT
ncbi:MULTISPECIES: YheT family hydrolase [Tenacibaculum]|uniref:YheT family hydrolase n=1 Tax=Tenacibaculum TaxID=104267 RepID=UPI001F0A301C|nr:MULTISPECIES: alpha/beta fold hydrolase [Tenacibaculum]MCH3881962.1 alpha/beta fold hydrolase [Tenacibaculum aquimarinum]MDO6600715.1 alpha/beta fold hydrolase [Tenacibaculum sp. 1_MG-2023]